MNNIPYLLALHSIDGLGPIRLKAIIDYFKDPKLAWEAQSQETRKKLEPESYARSIQELGIKWLTIFDEGYPQLLKQIYDPPIILYYKGQVDVLNTKSLAVVGTRKMTGYGRAVTENFVRGLASAGLTIVSGLARGVDAQAHKSAIDTGGSTIAVLGGGLKNIYPPENRNLSEQIVESGAVISEFPPDFPSTPGNFPSRNRILSGLSLAVLVTEAAEDSGSLITARLALEQGREVFAVPGPITSDLSKGPANLIREGATIVTQASEILEELGIQLRRGFAGAEEEKKILEVLGEESLHIDDVCRSLKLPASEVSASLLKMEIKGIVQNLGGGTYCKV